MKKYSGFYNELEKRGWIGNALTMGIGAWGASSTIKENKGRVALDSQKSLHDKYMLGTPDQYTYNTPDATRPNI